MLHQHSAPRPLLFEALNGGRQLRVLHVQILHKHVRVGQALRLLVDDNALRFQRSAQVVDLGALLLPRFCWQRKGFVHSKDFRNGSEETYDALSIQCTVAAASSRTAAADSCSRAVGSFE